MARIFIVFTILVFAFIGFAVLRKEKNAAPTSLDYSTTPVEIVIQDETPTQTPVVKEIPSLASEQGSLPLATEGLPIENHIEELFNVGEPKLPIVKTITYKSLVPWLEGRRAWISDYASHFDTSRHFIARSLNRKADYNKQDIVDGQHFNVLDPEKEIHFHLLIDASRSKLWFYAIDKTDHKKYLLKTYDVGLGRIDPSKASGLLTPLGVYSLGSRIAIYKPNVTGYHNGSKAEMIQIFGTRWIPFDMEVANTTAPARGFGIHGVPWIRDSDTEQLVEQRDSIRTYDSDGCIRLLTEDIEEIFAITITRPTTIEIVRDFKEAEHLTKLN